MKLIIRSCDKIRCFSNFSSVYFVETLKNIVTFYFDEDRPIVYLDISDNLSQADVIKIIFDAMKNKKSGEDEVFIDLDDVVCESNLKDECLLYKEIEFDKIGSVYTKKRIKDALSSKNLLYYKDLINLTESELKKIPGLGDGCVSGVIRHLKEKGLNFYKRWE